MPAVIFDFPLEQGSDFNITFQYNDINGRGIDLSNKCIVLRFTQSDGGGKIFSSATAASLENSDSGYQLIANSAGSINLQISSQKTKFYSFATAIYDLDIVETIGTQNKNTRLSTGKITIISRNFDVITDCSTLSIDPDIPAPTPIVTVTDTSPTPTPTIVPYDLCLPDDCIDLDIYSVVYSGSGIGILDITNNSGSVSTSDIRNIENIEIAINGLRHASPQDLTMIMVPPSGNKVLLSANSKISNYQNGFSFMFSNKAVGGSYINSVMNGGMCEILDKTSIVNFNDEILESGFSNLFNSPVTGEWTLLINDNDIGTSGSIDSWKLIITYKPGE